MLGGQKADRAALENDKKIDIYALAMIAFECACPGRLFPNMSRDDIVKNVMMGVRPQFEEGVVGAVGSEYQALVRQCWSQNPESRPTALYVVERIESLFLTLPSSSDITSKSSDISSVHR